MKNTTQQPLKRKWTGSTNKNGELHSAYMGSYHISLPNKAVVSIDRLQSTSFFFQLQFLKKVMRVHRQCYYPTRNTISYYVILYTSQKF